MAHPPNEVLPPASRRAWSAEDWHQAVLDLMGRLRDDAETARLLSKRRIGENEAAPAAMANASFCSGVLTGYSDASTRLVDLVKRALEGGSVLPLPTIEERREQAAEAPKKDA